MSSHRRRGVRLKDSIGWGASLRQESSPVKAATSWRSLSWRDHPDDSPIASSSTVSSRPSTEQWVNQVLAGRWPDPRGWQSHHIAALSKFRQGADHSLTDAAELTRLDGEIHRREYSTHSGDRNVNPCTHILAPQTICNGSPAPTFTLQTQLVGIGCFSRSRT